MMKRNVRMTAFLGVLVILASVMLTATEGTAQIAPKRWHYVFGTGCVIPPNGYAALTNQTNGLADNGWEMVDVKPVGNVGTGTGCVIVIMRQMVAAAPRQAPK
jgi:hypothetical protein